jgi:SMODS and SLOG-associating 2TM effector domain 2
MAGIIHKGTEKVQLPPASTLLPIDFDPRELAQLDFAEFCKSLLAKLREIKSQRYDWYDAKRRQHSKWVNGSCYMLAILGSAAILLTAIGAALRISNTSALYDFWALIIALVLYAIMGAVSFFDKTTDSASAYFRHLVVQLAIRDLWTRLEFELLKEFLATKLGDAGAEAAATNHICTLAEAFCRDLDKISSAELSEWRTEFLASLSQLEAAAKQGAEHTQKQLLDAVKAIEKASADALKAAQEAAQAAFMILKVEGADGDVAVLIDDAQVAVTHLKSIPIDRVRPTRQKIVLVQPNFELSRFRVGRSQEPAFQLTRSFRIVAGVAEK